MKRRPKSGGGWPAILYTLARSREAGGYRRMWRALRARNACKTCALGMGGQRGGMVNEAGRFPEVCKKSVQAMAADMRGKIRDGFFDEFPIEKLKRLSSRELEAAGRITTPLYAGPGDAGYRAISWDAAMARIGGRMRATAPDDAFFYFSGRSSNEAGFLLQLAARVYGTNNVNNCSFYCHQASGVGLASVTGSGTATISLDDVEKCDLVFLIGANPASNHPRLMRSLIDLRRRGGQVVVVNPLKELGLVRFSVPSDARSLLFGSKIADEYVQPHIGGDIALLLGVGKAALERGAVDRPFVEGACDGWTEFERHLTALSWEQLVAGSGVDRAQIERVAEMYGASRGAIFCWAMGMTHHEHGVRNVQTIAALAMLRGMLGREGAGLLPLRGHSNVQGIGSVGAVPQLKGPMLERLEREFGVALPKDAGMDTLECIRRADEGRVALALCLGGNLYGSNPDAEFAAGAMARIGLTVYLSTTLNTGHAHGRGRETIILPVRARDEEAQATTQESMFNYVRLSDGGPARYDGPRSEVEVIAEIADRGIAPRADGAAVDWRALRDHANIRAAIGRVVPGYEAIGAMDRSKAEFHVAGRTFHRASFPTATGRAKFHVFDPPALKGGRGDTLRLMTIRSEGQFNTVVYEEEDRYRAQERRDVVLMHPGDMARFGLREDDAVTVRSETGAMRGVLARSFDIRAGNCAMYYPEANAIVPRLTDDASRTPAFKSVVVTIEKERPLPVLGGAPAVAADGARAGAAP